MEFDGNEGSYIEVPPSDTFDLTEFSFFAWMKREDVAAEVRVALPLRMAQACPHIYI